MKIVGQRGESDLATVYIGELSGGELIEFVESVQPPIPQSDKWVLIVSTLKGCPVNCPICDAGTSYAGKLSFGEIIGQIDYMVRKRYSDGKVPVSKFKIQFARMGDPAFNPAVLDVLQELPFVYDAPGLLPSISTIAPRGCDDFWEKLTDIKNRLYPGADFVAKNDDFVKFAGSILDLAIAEKPADLEALKALSLDGKVLADVINERSGTIGEKLELAYFDFIKAETVQAYNHFGNNLATLVGFSKADVDEQVAKDVAMQIAAMAPVAVDRDDVPAEVIEQERKIGREKALLEGKPENIVDRIADGMVNKFLKEATLLNQDFTKDSKKTIAQYLKESDKDLKVTGFKRFSVK